MSRRQRRGEKPETNISMIILTGIVLVVVVAFILTYVSYSNRMVKNAKLRTTNTQVISSVDNEMLNMITNDTDSKSVSSPVGKSVNEMENTEKVAVNTSDYENKTKEEKKETSGDATLLYFFEDISIVSILKNANVIVAKYSDISIEPPNNCDVAARKYKDEQILYDKIYNSFFEREEEIKLKREKK